MLTFEHSTSRRSHELPTLKVLVEASCRHRPHRCQHYSGTLSDETVAKNGSNKGRPGPCLLSEESLFHGINKAQIRSRPRQWYLNQAPAAPFSPACPWCYLSHCSLALHSAFVIHTCTSIHACIPTYHQRLIC
jgi:hypothetical protein